MPFRKRRTRGRSTGWEPWEAPYPASRPRPVPDGLRTKSARGAIGETWWSRRFLDVLEGFRQGARLARGRAYARAGQVMELEVTPGRVVARVQGSRARPYRVSIDTAVLTDDEWARVEGAMAGRAVFLARLLAGEMPDEIEEAFEAARLSLFPAEEHELGGDCSCPDWANPCKHIAAVYYLLAEAFDRDPFLIFAWRGRPRERLLAELRALRGGAGPSDDIAGQDTGRGRGGGAPVLFGHAGRDVAELTRGLDNEDLPRFWSSGADLQPLRAEPRPAARADAILRDLGPSGLLLRGRPIEDLLSPVYAAISAAALRLASGEEPVRVGQFPAPDAAGGAAPTSAARMVNAAPGLAVTTGPTSSTARRSVEPADRPRRRSGSRTSRSSARRGPSRRLLEGLIEAATVDCYNESEERTGFFEMLRENVSLPFKATIAGATVEVAAIDMTTDDEIVAVCRRGRQTHRIPLTALTPVPPLPDGVEWLDAYRLWARGR